MVDIRMPDGTILRGIPEGTTKEEIGRRYGLYSAPEPMAAPEPVTPEPEAVTPAAEMEEAAPEPFAESETPDNLGIGRGESFVVPDAPKTPEEEYQALPEMESERSYTQQYNDETVKQGKQRTNEDGTTTTVLSKTGELDGKWYNVPGFDRDTGKDYESDDAAIEAARADIEAGKVTAYATGEEAISAATEEHKELEGPPAREKADATIDSTPFADPKEARMDWFSGLLATEAVDRKTLRETTLEPEGPEVEGWWEGRWSAFAGKQNHWMAGILEGMEDLSHARRGFQLSPDRTHHGIIGSLKERAKRLNLIGAETAERAKESAGAAGGALTEAMTMYGTDVIDGAANMLPSIVTAKIGGGNLGLAEMGLQVWGTTYSDAKEEGEDSVGAFYDATRATAYEIGPEKLFGFFDKLGGKGVRDWAMQALREGASEIVTSILEQGDEVLIEGEAWGGWAKATKRALYDFALGLGMGGMISAPMAFQKADEAPTDEAPPDDGPALEDADPREVIRKKSHSELMESPLYKRFYDASDLGELSAPHEERAKEAKDAFIRKAEKIKKWAPILDEIDAEREAAAPEEEPVGVEAAVEERQVFEEEKVAEPTLPDGFDPSETVHTNVNGEEVERSLEEAAELVEKFDKNEETSTISREERDQLDVQLDEYRQRYDEQESIDSPRSEAREGRDVKLPEDVMEVDASTLELKPELMQYKSKTDTETGRNKALEGIEKFDQAKAGIIIAWEDVNGRRVVADGHQRVNLLKDLQAQGKEKDTKILTRVYRQEDGFTAKDVRTVAAEINIAQGTGTAMDAAKVIRELTDKEYTEFIAKMPVTSSLVRDAVGLSKLGEEAFQVVVNELIEPRFGSMVGNAFEESEQTAAMQILIKSKPSNFNEAYAMIADIQAGGFVKSEQGGLFGEVEMESLIKERAEILNAAESKLKKNVSVFNALTKEETRIEGAGNVLDTEANKAIAKEAGSIIDLALRTINTNPELNNELNRISKQYKAGAITKAAAANEFVEAAKSYTDSSSGKLADKPGVEGSGEQKGEGPAETGAPAKKEGKKAKKKPSQITLEEEMEIEETGEVVTVSENGAQALLRVFKRTSVVNKIRDCLLS